MRKGVSGVRRVAAILSVSLVTLLVTSTGAGAAAPKLVNVTGLGNGQVLHLNIQLPSALNAVLQPAGLSNVIDQTVSFSRSFGQIERSARTGTGLGQVMDGTLNPVLESLLKPLNKALPKAFATLGEALKTDTLLEQNIADIVKLGVMRVEAVSQLKTAPDGLKAVVGHSKASILGLEVDLGDALTGLLDSLPVNVVQPVDGLIDTINGGLNDLLNTVPQLKQVVDQLGVDLQVPTLESILSKPLLKIGLIETSSETGLKNIARTAKGVTTLADINILGNDETDALVHIESLTTETAVAIDGTKAGAVADAVSHIAKAKVLGLDVDFTKDLLKIGNLSVPLPTQDVLGPLQNLLAETLGLNIDVLGKKKFANPTHAYAEANTVRISLAPLNGALGQIQLDGPLSTAEVQGSTVQDVDLPTPLPTTGVPTTAYFLAGPALLGMAVLVRRFMLVK